MLTTKTITIEGLSKKFGSITAVEPTSLTIPGGEFVTLLGPSGCGKTTLLRMIAGLEIPTMGRLYLQEEDITSVPANHRDTSIMFQDYALFPHKTVQGNIEFGLRVRGVSKEERTKRARQALDRVRLPDMASRYPSELSGGQKQRVALARCLVIEPSVLLLDEPLSALDANLREEMQVELKTIQRDLGITFIAVTHDQQEALSISDRIILMRDGAVEQDGRPHDVYNSPRSQFVAKFIGNSNIFQGRAKKIDSDLIEVDVGEKRPWKCHNPWCVPINESDNLVCIAVRPEAIEVTDTEPANQNSIRGEVAQTLFFGSYAKIRISLSSGHEVTAIVDKASSVPTGEQVVMQFAPESCTVVYE